MKNSMNIKKLSSMALFACISINGLDLSDGVRTRLMNTSSLTTPSLTRSHFSSPRPERALSKKEYAQGLAYGLFVPLASTVATIATIKLTNPELTEKDCISLGSQGLFLSSFLSGMYYTAKIVDPSLYDSKEKRWLIANVQGSAITASLPLIMTAGIITIPHSDFFEANYERLSATTGLVGIVYNIAAPILSAIIKKFRS